MGSGLSTMPSPPPKGRSSTVRWRSWVKARRIVVIDRIDARELEHDAPLMRPVFLELDRARGRLRCQQKKPLAFGEALGKVGQQIG
jgi:hypothetical protein